MIIVVNIALVLFGAVLYPTVMNEGDLLGIIAAIFILLIYGFLALSSPISIEKTQPGLLKLSELLGSIAGMCLVIDLVSGYIFERDAAASAQSSLVAYGILLSLLLLTGFLAARSTGKIPAGLQWLSGR